jgi:hypothetical protein
MTRKFVAVLLLLASMTMLGQSKKSAKRATAPAKKVTLSAQELAFRNALAEARKQTKTKEGADYEVALSTEFVRRHGKSMDRCTAIPNADLRSFDILAKVTADGSSSDLMVWPETNVATCVKKDMVGEVFPKPPHHNYWAHIYMEMRPE